jgi:hypothetical protein
MTTASEQQQPSPVLAVLSLLDTYATKHEQGNDFQKQSFWNLHKARHRKSARGLLANNTVQASCVREELRAQTVLLRQNEDGSVEIDNEPDLVHDDDDNNNEKGSPLSQQAPRFVLVNAVEQKREAEKENAAAASSSATSTTDAAAGLRNRKKTSTQHTQKVAQAKDVKDDAKTKWTEEEPQIDLLDEEGRLLAADPLLLFGGGLPPRELMVAQSQAKEALAMYVEAANLVAAIQHELSLVQAKK